MYVVTCKDNGKVYVGTTVNVNRRMGQHRRSPPLKMRPDAAKYQPFNDHFTCKLRHTFTTLLAALATEARLIVELKARDPAFGYNVCRSSPGRAAWFRIRQRSAARLAASQRPAW